MPLDSIVSCLVVDSRRFLSCRRFLFTVVSCLAVFPVMLSIPSFPVLPSIPPIPVMRRRFLPVVVSVRLPPVADSFRRLCLAVVPILLRYRFRLPSDLTSVSGLAADTT
jgi:hypothetical protein